MEKYKLTLWPSGKIIQVDAGTSMLEAMKSQGEYVKSSCGGHATCGDCVVKVMSGESNLTPPPFEEIRLLGNVFHITKERLSCQTKLMGDVSVDVSLHDENQDQMKNKKKSNQFVKTQTILKKKGPSSAGAQSSFSNNRRPQEERTKVDRDGKKAMGGNRRPRPFKSTPEDSNGNSSGE